MYKMVPFIITVIYGNILILVPHIIDIILVQIYKQFQNYFDNLWHHVELVP